MQREDVENPRIMLGLLESVERDGGQTQRHLASELGIALGLVNAYLKRCIKKGLVKVGEAPARRYAYYLTPQGFAEKSRLTVEYLTYSFSLFRRARADYSSLLTAAGARGFSRIVLAGVSDLAEIAAICAMDHGAEIIAIVDADATASRFVGRPVVRSLDEVPGEFDAVLLTDLKTAQATYDALLARFPPERVLVPPLLGLPLASIGRAEAEL
jgi:DNA-binding MarR family transcriptional regulator